MKTIRFVTITAVLLLGGCASLEDFQQMGPSERASYVCDRDSDLAAVQYEINGTEAALHEVQDAIAKGYRLRQFCKEVPIVSSSEEVCKTDEGVKTCKTKSKISHETACEEKPIAIDGQLEREKESQHRDDLSQLRVLWDEKYNRCFNTVRQMSAEEAFQYHKNR